jgi:hypothetical protein
MFEFSSLQEFIEMSSCDNAEEVAIAHLHWIPRYYEVYGSGTAKSSVERKLRFW